GAVTRSSVAVAIADERDYRSDALGPVRVTVIEETWTRGGRKQTGIAYVSRFHAAVAYWRRDGGGGMIEECQLIALRDPYSGLPKRWKSAAPLLPYDKPH